MIRLEKITSFDLLQDATIRFEKLLREHLTREDEDFSPHAQAILNDKLRAEAGEKKLVILSGCFSCLATTFQASSISS
jgi:hypothetical protein